MNRHKPTGNTIDSSDVEATSVPKITRLSKQGMIRISHVFFHTILILFFTTSTSLADESIDVSHYQFNLTVSDDSDIIRGEAVITIKSLARLTSFEIDLKSRGADGKGMTVSAVRMESRDLRYAHASDLLRIYLPEEQAPGSYFKISIFYSGIPRDGLIIASNKHGDRTFFGDNWPDRAHNWLPTVDSPADKATVEFAVTAPDHYQVISNGRLVEESDNGNGTRLTRWSSAVPLPTKVMVVGIARFAVDHVGVFQSVPVQSWVYPQEREEGFHDYEMAWPILEYFTMTIGPFPFEKLANVQSKTIYGGMENAGAIFYHENSIDGNRSSESLFAHEIAHQWFGDSVTEKDFHHVWLSEGFATYLTHLYLEHRYGTARMNTELQATRRDVLAYAERNPESPVVDSTITVLTDLLSANSYQKGGWVLHMLRREIGDDAFREGLRRYYSTFRDSNALTDDFKAVMELVSGSDLDWFFDQWVYTPSVPSLNVTWSYNDEAASVVINASQRHPSGAIYQLPVEIGIIDDSGAMQIVSFRMLARSGRYSFPVESRPQRIVVDPDTNILANITLGTGQ